MRDLTFVSTHPSSEWTKQILSDLNNLGASKAKGRAIPVSMPEPLDLEYVLEAYESSGSVGLTPNGTRLFIFDYGGTLLHKEKFDIYIKQTLSAISGRRPTDAVMEAVRRLSEDPRNVVMVMTGLTRIKLGDTFKGMKNVTLVTSNGLVYSWGANLQTMEEKENLKRGMPTLSSSASSSSSSAANLAAAAAAAAAEQEYSDDRTPHVDDEGRVWSYLDFQIDWQSVCKVAVPIISKFTYRTNGTCLSPRIPGVGWSYFGADPDWGEKQATQLRIDLEAALANYDVKVAAQIQGSIELVPKELNKGVFVKQFLSRVVSHRAGKLPAFGMVFGDEPSDDLMFSSMYEFIGECPPSAGLKTFRGFTVCVGKRTTPAYLYANDVKDVEHILSALASSQGTIEPQPEDQLVVDAAA